MGWKDVDEEMNGEQRMNNGRAPMRCMKIRKVRD